MDEDQVEVLIGALDRHSKALQDNASAMVYLAEELKRDRRLKLDEECTKKR